MRRHHPPPASAAPATSAPMPNLSTASLWAGLLAAPVTCMPSLAAAQPAPTPFVIPVAATRDHAHDPWPALVNPACAAETPTMLAAAYAPTPFGLAELNRAGFVASLPFDSVGFVISLAGTSAGPFASARAVCMAARALTPMLTLGLAFDLDCQSVTGYETSVLGWIAAGLLIRPFEGLSIGIVVDNLTGSRRDAEASQMIAVGAAVRVGDSVELTIDLDQRLRQPVGAGIGLDWTAAPHCGLRAGMSLTPLSVGGGLSLDLDSLQVDISGRFAEPLGVTATIGVSVRIPSPSGSSTPAAKVRP